MLESYKNRVQFRKKGIQQNYILKVENVLNMTDSELAQKLKLCKRTIWDWRKERITMTHEAVKRMSKWSRIKIPRDHVIIDWRLHYIKMRVELGQ